MDRIKQEFADSGEQYTVGLASGEDQSFTQTFYETVELDSDVVTSTITDESDPGSEDTVTLTLYAVVEGENGPEYVAANTINEDGGTGTYVVRASINGSIMDPQPGGTDWSGLRLSRDDCCDGGYGVHD